MQQCNNVTINFMDSFSTFEDRLEIKFKNKDLLKQSLVHRSYLNEHPDFPLNHNERLEFLGDAILEVVVTEYLFLNYPKKEEGELTNWRASLVNAKMLAQVAHEIEIEDLLYLSKGESKDKNSKARGFILADAVEALIGAIYLDGGIKAASKFINKEIISKLENILENKLYFDSKSRFQEISQEKQGVTPHYKVLSETGPDHEKIFEVGLYIGDDLVTRGEGFSKQEAQVKAAEKGLLKKKW